MPGAGAETALVSFEDKGRVLQQRVDRLAKNKSLAARKALGMPRQASFLQFRGAVGASFDIEDISGIYYRTAAQPEPFRLLRLCLHSLLQQATQPRAAEADTTWTSRTSNPRT